MSSSPSRASVSPWRRIFEQVRSAVGHRRDEHGVLGSINWLRYRMNERGANPNVVRNIIYRDKGKPADKRVLFELLNELWTEAGHEPLHAPDLELMFSSHGNAEQEALQLLGRETRRAFRVFVGALREGGRPKLLVTGRPGSGKTMLADFVQGALQRSPAGGEVIRTEFGAGDLGARVVWLGEALGAARGTLETRLAKIGSAGAFAVQADAQADLARTVVDAARAREGGTTLLLHVSKALATQDTLGTVPIRLNAPDVPRVSAPDWLWTNLLVPLAALPRISILVSMTDVPATAAERVEPYEGPLKLTPPTAAEAKRFVKGRLPNLAPAQQDEIVARAGRSFEELRTLTLLAEVRASIPRNDPEASIARLAELGTTTTDARLRDFLSAVAVLSLPEFPTFELEAVDALRPEGQGGATALERSFVDPVPGTTGGYRCFSRSLVRALRARIEREDPERYRALHLAAAERLRERAEASPTSQVALERMQYLFHARDWASMVAFMDGHGVPGSVVSALWKVAGEELAGAEPDLYEAVAERVADHYVQLGSHRHPDAAQACAVLAASAHPRRRAWATLKQAEAALFGGRHDAAVAFLSDWPGSDHPPIEAEAALLRASIARWRGDLDAAEGMVRAARSLVEGMEREDPAERVVRANVALWAGVIHKDRGEYEAAVAEFEGAEPESDLLRARLAFKSADTLMQLGRFEAAERAFDAAVDLSLRSGALVSERARYLVRRATLRRRSGVLGGAEEDLDLAGTILQDADGDPVERDFWFARVDDGHALLRLARGQHGEAIELLASTVARHRAYGDAHGVDCAYRVDRAVLRLGAAYAARALDAPWAMPFPHRPPAPFVRLDLDQARRLLSRVIARRTGAPGDPHAVDALGRRALLASSLVEPPEVAVEEATRALNASHFAYPRAEARAHLAAAHLRAGEVEACRRVLDEAFADLASLHGDAGDPGLRAWLSALRLRAHVSADAARAAMRDLDRVLRTALPEVMKMEALRAFGEALEYEDRLSWLEHPCLPVPLGGPPECDLLRPGDLLVRRWRRAAKEPSVSYETVA